MHTGPARGMRDFLPEDVRRRQYVIDIVRGVYQRYGFEPLETPALENIETLTGKYGEEGNKLIYKVLRRGEGEASGEADLALRYDLTVPLARVVADNRGTLPKFFKRYQIQPVWRADRPARGRFREFYQCDLDAIGSTSPVVEAELLAAVSDVLESLGFSDFSIRLNHRDVLRAALSVFGVPEERHADALIALDKHDKVGAEGVRAEMVKRGISDRAAETFIAILANVSNEDRPTANRKLLDGNQEMLAADARAVRAIGNLRSIIELSVGTSSAMHIVIDSSLARGLSYYTGAIMEIAVEGIGSLGGGGRYDGLIGMFSGEQIPACGFSLGLERILVVMGERGMFPARVDEGGPDVLVTIFAESLVSQSTHLAGLLRTEGLIAELYPEPSRSRNDFSKQLKYATARNARYIAIMDEQNAAAGEVRLRDMKTGEQLTLAGRGVAPFIRERSNHQPSASDLQPPTSDRRTRQIDLE